MKLNCLFVCAVCCLLAWACDDSDGGRTYHYYWERDAEEYGVDKPGIQGVHKEWMGAEKYWGHRKEKVVCFYGSLDGHFWVKAYDAQTKREVLDWTDEEPMEKTVLRGDTLMYLSYYDIRRYELQGEKMVFTMTTNYRNDSLPAYGSCGYLYFVDPSGTQKKIKYQEDYGGLDDIWNWSDGHVMLEKYVWMDSLRLECYTLDGQLLYETRWSSYYHTIFEAVTTDEVIYFIPGRMNTRLTRLNFKTGQVVWTSRPLLSVIPGKPREGKLETADFVDKLQGDHWICSFYFTPNRERKMDFQIRLNVETGEFELIL